LRAAFFIVIMDRFMVIVAHDKAAIVNAIFFKNVAPLLMFF